MARRILVFTYGCIAYLGFLCTILYAIGFVGGFVVPKTIDSGTAGVSWGWVVFGNLCLLSLFAIQHTIMARPQFKRRWTKIIPPEAERSTFVLATVVVFGLLYWQWRPLPTVLWDFPAPLMRGLMYGCSMAGWGLVVYATFLIDHFDLFGLRQSYYCLRGREYVPPVFQERSIYRWVRHPLMLGFIIALWFTPTMTVGHLLFASVVTVYIMIGTTIEERDLVAAHGDRYRDYQRRTPKIIPWHVPFAQETSEQVG